MRALLHVHSRYSYDGTATLEDLSSWGARRGLDLVFLTEHTNDFDEKKMARLVEHCDALEREPCRLIPGLEFATRGGFHVLAFNVRAFARLVEPAEVARFIKAQGGIAVLAHPGRYRGSWPEDGALGVLDGIEAWNARYEGRFLPSGSMLAECARRARSTARGLLFGGQDLHELTEGRLVATTLAGADTLPAAVRALGEGGSTFGAPPISIESGRPAAATLVRAAAVAHAGYRLMRAIRARSAGLFRGSAGKALR